MYILFPLAKNDSKPATLGARSFPLRAKCMDFYTGYFPQILTWEEAVAVASALLQAEGGFSEMPPRSFLQQFGSHSQSNLSTGKETHAELDRVANFSESPHTQPLGFGVPLSL